MIGTYSHTIDAKGRLFMPGKLRSELGESFYITLYPGGGIGAYPKSEWDRMMEKIEALPALEQQRMRPIRSHAANVEFDSQGRILIPQFLREYAGLEKEVTVVGNGRNAEIWNADTYRALDEAETTRENIEALFAKIL